MMDDDGDVDDHDHHDDSDENDDEDVKLETGGVALFYLSFTKWRHKQTTRIVTLCYQFVMMMMMMMI